jgi:hypothetical protein
MGAFAGLLQIPKGIQEVFIEIVLSDQLVPNMFGAAIKTRPLFNDVPIGRAIKLHCSIIA